MWLTRVTTRSLCPGTLRFKQGVSPSVADLKITPEPTFEKWRFKQGVSPSVADHVTSHSLIQMIVLVFQTGREPQCG